MFVLQDCSICFEDYDAERNPHNVPCGHVFCRPCLDSLASSSPNCPNCRTPFTSDTIRKVVCGMQDPPAPSASTSSEAETIMWQAIQSAVESADEHEQRRSLVQNNSASVVQEAGLSGNVLIALDVMRLLVDVEHANRGLNNKVDTARAFEASLRDSISLLEAQLSASKADSSASMHDIQSLMSDMRELKSSIRTIDKTTTQIARKLDSSEPPPTPSQIYTPPTPMVTQQRLPLTAEFTVALPSPELPRILEQRAPPQPKPSVLRKHSPRGGFSSIFTPSTTSLVEPEEARSPGPEHQRTMSLSLPRQMMSPPTPTTRLVSPPTPSPTMSRQLMSPPTPSPQQMMSPQLTPGARPLFGHPALFKRNTVSQTGAQPNMEMPLPSIPGHGGVSPRSSYGAQQPTPASTPSTSTSQIHMFSLPPYQSQSQSQPTRTRTSPLPQPTPNTPSKRTITALHDYTAVSSTELSFTAGEKLELLPGSDANLNSGSEWVWCGLGGKVGYAPRSYLRGWRLGVEGTV